MKNTLKVFAKVLISITPDHEWLIEFWRNNRKFFQYSNILDLIWAYRKGFHIETIQLCEITRENIHEYLSDKAYLKLHPINKEYSKIIDNKLYLPFLFKDYPDLVPKYYYVIDNGRLVQISPPFSGKQGLLELCKEKHFLALKPCSSTMGQGFYRLEWKNNSFFLNNQSIEVAELNFFIKSLDNYLVTEYIEQNKYSADINQSSINTVRLICIKDTINNEFFIPISNHRFGMKGKFVDNVGAEGGGIAACIDIPTGQIKEIGCIKVNGMVKKSFNVTVHPDSKKQISGITIPNWHKMIKEVLGVMNHLSFLKYAGLDIVITEKGFKIIEINSLPTLLGLQLEEGVLKNAQLKRFFISK